MALLSAFQNYSVSYFGVLVAGMLGFRFSKDKSFKALQEAPQC